LHNWRIYRLPGSKKIWHIDSGPCTPVVNVTGYVSNVPNRSIGVGGENVPREWIEVCSRYFLHIVDGVAYFDPFIYKPRNICAVEITITCVPAQEIKGEK